MNFGKLKLMRTGARVQRMHTMPGHHMQTVGEHTFGVIAIILIITESYPSPYKDGKLLALIKAAMYHDVAEAITGDVPATVKWRHILLDDALKEVERRVDLEFGLSVGLTEHEHSLLKYADIMELAMYSIEECDSGNQKAAVVAWNCMDALESRRLTDITPDALELFDLVKLTLEANYPKDKLREDIFNGWPLYR